MTLDELYGYSFTNVENPGFSILRDVTPLSIATTGYMVKTALNVAAELGKQGVSVGVLDICRLPLNESDLVAVLKEIKQLIIVEEHIKQGGLGSYICDLLSEQNIQLSVKRFAFDFAKGFYHKYGSREEMHKACGIGLEKILSELKTIYNQSENNINSSPHS
jgi:transketolase C-terminal domain/subunit